MSLVKWAFLGLLALPAAELVAFMIVAALIGWQWAGVALVATSILGVMLLRRTGRRDLARFADAVRADGLAALHLDAPGAANMLAALLLVVPGFVTDALGAALFVPAFRRWASAALARPLTAARRHRHGAPGEIIDLEPGEWRQIPEERRPRQRSPRRKTKSG
jgi:UPF0716 protein FxsA